MPKPSALEIPTRQDIHLAYIQGEEAVVVLFEKTFTKMATVIQDLSTRIEQLENQRNKNSSNSSKPPSTDGFKNPLRTKSLRVQSGKNPGRQKGHPGETLKQVENPDQIITHSVLFCENCFYDLTKVVRAGQVKRQVFDLPEMSITVTEHQAEKKRCPHCGQKNTASFPEDVNEATQYGFRIKAQSVYFYHGQFSSLERTQQTLFDLYGITLSEATILSAVTTAAKKVQPIMFSIKQFLTYLTSVVHFDETGLKVAKKLFWLHSVSSQYLTYYKIHKKRGSEAQEAVGILPHFKGIAIHDHFETYFHYMECSHGECNAHHLRELKYITECYHQIWSKRMEILLLLIKKSVERAKTNGQTLLTTRKLKRFSRLYDAMIKEGLRVNPIPHYLGETRRKKRGKHTEPQNLLLRLKLFKKSTLGFMYDFSIPFDNNQAERDIRMVKLRQKVSGCFRTEKYAAIFCTIRSYLSTVRKHGHGILAALESLFRGTPYIPETLFRPQLALPLPK